MVVRGLTKRFGGLTANRGIDYQIPRHRDRVDHRAERRR